MHLTMISIHVLHYEINILESIYYFLRISIDRVISIRTLQVTDGARLSMHRDIFISYSRF